MKWSIFIMTTSTKANTTDVWPHIPPQTTLQCLHRVLQRTDIHTIHMLESWEAKKEKNATHLNTIRLERFQLQIIERHKDSKYSTHLVLIDWIAAQVEWCELFCGLKYRSTDAVDQTHRVRSTEFDNLYCHRSKCNLNHDICFDSFVSSCGL